MELINYVTILLKRFHLVMTAIYRWQTLKIVLIMILQITLVIFVKEFLVLSREIVRENYPNHTSRRNRLFIKT